MTDWRWTRSRGEESLLNIPSYYKKIGQANPVDQEIILICWKEQEEKALMRKPACIYSSFHI